jgi:hypothetical protein
VTTYLYRLPDGSNDMPDENGRHTATKNVMHSAEQSRRFTGCEQCQRIVRLDIEACLDISFFSGWNGTNFTESAHMTVGEALAAGKITPEHAAESYERARKLALEYGVEL